MNIRYISNTQIDKNAWDKCIIMAVNGTIYAYSWYLDLVCEDWDALVSGDYETVFPLPFRNKAGITYLYQPFFTQQLGIFSNNHLTPDIVEAFLKAIPEKFRFAEINLNSFNKPDEKRWRIKHNANYELDLIESYDRLSSRYSANTKRNITKAVKNGITVSNNLRPDEIVKIFRETRGKDFPHLRENDYRRLLRLIYHCLHDQKAICYGAYTRQNALCAGAVLLFSHHKAIFIFSGTGSEARATGAMSLLIDRIIQDSAGNHLTLDFEGSNDANLARFYGSFGAARTTYPSLRFNHLPLHLKAMTGLAKILRRMIAVKPGNSKR